MRPISDFAFVARRPSDAGETPTFKAVGSMNGIRLQGGLTAGGGGWVLSARATRHRRRVDLTVTARQLEPHAPEQLEDHLYEAVIGSLIAGRYQLRVVHVFFVHGVRRSFTTGSVFEQRIVVGPPKSPQPQRRRPSGGTPKVGELRPDRVRPTLVGTDPPGGPPRGD